MCSAHDFLVAVAPGDSAGGLENVEGLFVQVAGDVPAAKLLVEGDGFGEGLGRKRRKEACDGRRDFGGRRGADPLPGFGVRFQEGLVRPGVQEPAGAAEAAEGNFGHGRSHRSHHRAGNDGRLQVHVVPPAGLEGSGQELFLRLASGIKKPTQGTITLNGIRMNGRDHHAFKDMRVVFMPTARLEEGLIPGLSITEHVALQNRQKGFIVRWLEWLQKAEQRITQFHIKGKPNSKVETLSGGNQQRLLLSLLPETPRLLLLENPTRGLDVESTHWIWEQLQHHRRNQASIVFSSTELDEILMIAHRILVFFEGRLIKDVDTKQTNIHELGKAIAGKH